MTDRRGVHGAANASRAAGGLDHAITAMFFVGLAGIAWLSVFGHRGIAPCLGFMGLIAAFRADVWRDGLALLTPVRLAADPLARAFAALVVFSLWIAISGAWSPKGGAPSLAAGVLAAPLVAGALAHEIRHRNIRWRRMMATVFVGAIWLASFALCVEAFTGGFLRSIVPPEDLSPLRWKDMTALGRGVTAITPAVFPAMVMLRILSKSWAPAVVLFVVILFAASGFSISANVIALCTGAAAFAAALRFPRAMVIATGIIFLTLIIFAPVWALVPREALLAGEGPALPASWLQRVIIWQGAASQALSHCLPFGCGADYARVWHESAAEIAMPGSPIPLSEMPTHPHNLFLQVWLELGIVGVLSLAALCVFGVRAALNFVQLGGAMAAAAMTGAAAAICLSFQVETSLWQVWRLAAIALAVLGVALSYSINYNAVESRRFD
ncbi:MAG: O-antigen ligase family protein [Parvularculaceae bacterium]|nr:O-antigen ligase family protein [Parvularculaceae bacterium]